MKDLKLPNYSAEEELEIFENLKPGDILVEISTTYWGRLRYNIKKRRVVRRTPSGRIRMENNDLVNHLPRNCYPNTPEIGEIVKKIILEKEIFNLLYKADKDQREFCENLTYKDAIKLEEILGKIIGEVDKNKWDV